MVDQVSSAIGQRKDVSQPDLVMQPDETATHDFCLRVQVIAIPRVRSSTMQLSEVLLQRNCPIANQSCYDDPAHVRIQLNYARSRAEIENFG